MGFSERSRGAEDKRTDMLHAGRLKIGSEEREGD